MEPTLRDGDWLLVDPLAYRGNSPGPGDLVVADDPRAPGRSIVKRVKSVESDGSLAISGDHPAHQDDGIRTATSNIRGRVWFRYWPPRRFGRVG